MKLYLIKSVIQNVIDSEFDTKGAARKALKMLDKIERHVNIGSVIDTMVKEGTVIKRVDRYKDDNNPIEIRITEKDIERWILEKEE